MDDFSDEFVSPDHARYADEGSNQRIKRLVLTEGVAQTLAEGQDSPVERGWALMGCRIGDEVLIKAALPGGPRQCAGVAHVAFDADFQTALAREVRILDRDLRVVGVVHTHPDGLDEPTHADLASDLVWVANLRDRQAVFGIGTSRGYRWFTLREGGKTHWPIAVRVEPGCDMASIKTT